MPACSPGRQVHFPPVHVEGAGQALPQPPQFFGSVVVSVHMPAQRVGVPLKQAVLHA